VLFSGIKHDFGNPMEFELLLSNKVLYFSFEPLFDALVNREPISLVAFKELFEVIIQFLPQLSIAFFSIEELDQSWTFNIDVN
jgi:hypothetical protein